MGSNGFEMSMQLSKKQRTRQVIGKDSARRQRKRQEKSLQQMLPPAVEAIPVDTIARRRGQKADKVWVIIA